eukprot:TRINITY_DN2795_c0_g1_i4.p1 TRINITY_DN2795_c0_g1~~TRINITY_DN2795_c0_g1_i4.p1  ORF type:complete len:166 (+),score=38.85 TRINITY_DN2795_c0_g1_i4:709-1206(+)
MSHELANQLLGDLSAAAVRFATLGVDLDTEVPLESLFPGSRLGCASECSVLLPSCSPGEFAHDVGIRSSLHLSEVVRGAGRRRSCHGWRGALHSVESSVSEGSSDRSCTTEALDVEMECLVAFLNEPEATAETRGLDDDLDSLIDVTDLFDEDMGSLEELLSLGC